MDFCHDSSSFSNCRRDPLGEMGEIDVLIENQSGNTEPDPADDIPEIDEAKAPVSLPSDVWLLGPHRLACGNALSSESYARLMGHRRAQMVFTDPPYNVSIKGLSANGTAKHPDQTTVR